MDSGGYDIWKYLDLEIDLKLRWRTINFARNFDSSVTKLRLITYSI